MANEERRARKKRKAPTPFFYHIPSILQLLELFWPFNFLRKIVIVTNRYATHPLEALRNIMEAPKWVNIFVAELKAFLAIHMYIEMKQQPNFKKYWKKEGSVFHCL
jgi:hypothetical protein